jgi:Ferritin-like
MLRIQEFADKSEIVTVYSDPYLELIRLLREAAEIEHALMVQYLYAAFSVDPNYPKLSGVDTAFSNSTDLVGVAIQEMHHLDTVSSFIAAIGGTPLLESQDFPFEPDIYPFSLDLEPLTKHSVAKYVYAEAPKDFDRSDPDLATELTKILGDVRPNHVGSLYDALITTIGQIEAKQRSDPSYLSFITDPTIWTTNKAQLEDIKQEGIGPHFEFFKSIFLGTHESLKDVPNIWSLDPTDPNYPSVGLPMNPSAFVGNPHQIENADDRELAYLSNLHYWIVLVSLDAYYRYTLNRKVLRFAISTMTQALLPLGKHLASKSIGLPFDSSPIGYAPGNTIDISRIFVVHLLQEAATIAKKRVADLPVGFNLGIYDLRLIPEFKT